jgi:hypothetical protein
VGSLQSEIYIFLEAAIPSSRNERNIRNNEGKHQGSDEEESIKVRQ